MYNRGPTLSYASLRLRGGLAVMRSWVVPRMQHQVNLVTPFMDRWSMHQSKRSRRLAREYVEICFTACHRKDYDSYTQDKLPQRAEGREWPRKLLKRNRSRMDLEERCQPAIVEDLEAGHCERRHCCQSIISCRCQVDMARIMVRASVRTG